MNDPQAITLTLLATILAASLLGSLHCAGMCGGLVLFVIGADSRPTKTIPLQSAYHAGRGLSYTALGAGAGALGYLIDDASRLAGFQRTSALIAGSLMVLFGLAALAHQTGTRTPRVKPHPRLRRLVENAHRAAMSLTPIRRAAAVGLLTPLLPCGWLYAFVTVAAGTGTPSAGALVMAGFWLGTLPLLATLGVGLQALSGPLRARLPVLTSLIVVAFGVMTAMGRLSVPARAAPLGDTTEERVHAVSELGHEDLPCCAVSPEVLAGKPSEGPTQP
ncbi:MAG: sulfite exporter TauE/SafE family protein [Phycisphaerales bacterium JB040]